MKKTYQGSCHCGKIKIEADIDLEAGTGKCNCSICAKKRNWSVNIKPEDFRLVSGSLAEMGDYQFGTFSAHHRFCKTCGISPFGDGYVKEMGGAYCSINIACLDNISPEELARLSITYYDGLHNNWWNPPQITSYL